MKWSSWAERAAFLLRGHHEASSAAQAARERLAQAEGVVVWFERWRAEHDLEKPVASSPVSAKLRRTPEEQIEMRQVGRALVDLFHALVHFGVPG